MPVGSIIDYAGTTAPTGWLLCYGQTLNSVTNTEYAALYSAIGNTFGGSDGTDFVVPDLRGRVVAGQDDMGGTSANRLTAPSTTGSIDGDVFGATGGEEAHTQTVAELASHSHSIPSRDADDGGTTGAVRGTNAAVYFSSQSQGSSAPFNIVQPTIILNKIIKY